MKRTIAAFLAGAAVTVVVPLTFMQVPSAGASRLDQPQAAAANAPRSCAAKTAAKSSTTTTTVYLEPVSPITGEPVA